MKTLNFIMVAILVLIAACKTEKKEASDTQMVEKTIDTLTAAVLETAVIYEANIRQYSPEGTFAEFTKDIPQLKELGVKFIWLMPIFPISETKRKATGGKNAKFASEFPEEEQAKYLGSYYAVSDFKKINPEFGTIEDFRILLKTAHNNGIYVILDWVPNHTGWDHIWLKTNPEFYTQDEEGNVIYPEGTDWTDVADLNYDNQELRNAMIADMQYWVTEENVDGFRCDVAGSVPTDFWEQAVPQLRAKKELFMLAEAWEPELLKGNTLFDMCYAWDGHHLLNGLAKGEKTTQDWGEYLQKIDERYEEDDILMNFVTNHDENSWNGTIEERMGDASDAMTALTFCMQGMPLIYSGQEYGLSHRLKFFEKDSIPKTKGKEWELLKKLASLKQSNAALNGGKNAASFTPIDAKNDDVIAFSRSKNNDEVIYVTNLSDDEVVISLGIEGIYKDFMNNKEIDMTSESITLQANDYVIMVK